jgi:predicted Zn-dependent protease
MWDARSKQLRGGSTWISGGRLIARWSSIGMVLIGVLLLSCVTTGPGGKKSLILISTSQERSIGAKVALDVEAQERVLTDPVVTAYVTRVGQKTAHVSERKDLLFTFKVLDSDEVNAFACPGGYIYIYTGLLKLLDDEAELAAVLGHEVGHVVARHSVKQLQTVYGYSLILDLAVGEQLSKQARQVLDATMGLILLGYGRENEFEADHYGTLYAHRAGYDAHGMVSLLEQLQVMEGRPPSTMETLFASHPPTRDRLSRVTQQIRDEMPGTSSQPRYRTAYQEMKQRL